jgi:flagellar biosynthesis protein FlhF
MLLTILHTHRAPDALANTLADEAQASGLFDLSLALASALDQYMRAEPLDMSRHGAILLLGPPGAGKTAVAAKIAAQARTLGRDVRLVATDVESAGQAARLETFAAHLGAPVLQAPTPETFAAAVSEAREAGAFLIADSLGCDPRGTLPPELVAMTRMSGVETLGVVSAARDAEEAGEIAGGLKQFGVRRLIVTGVDLTRRKGALLALAASSLSVAHMTASPYLAHGLEALSPLALSAQLLAGAQGQTQKVA